MRAATIVTRPTAKGLLVCAPAYLGSTCFGGVGAILDQLTLLQLARQAALQGAKLMIEVQADGRPAFPSELPERWAEDLIGRLP